PAVVADMAPYHRWLDGPLHEVYAQAEATGDARKQLHASLALLLLDPDRQGYVCDRVLVAEPDGVVVIRDMVAPYKVRWAPRLWAAPEGAEYDPSRRLRAACALAAYAPDDERWEKVNDALARHLVTENALVIGKWAEALRPVRRSLLPPLAGMLLEEGHGPPE